MWEQYKKTFAGMQIVIIGVTAALYLKLGHSIAVATTFFVTMQLSAIIGAMFASKLKNKMEQRADALPLRPKA